MTIQEKVQKTLSNIGVPVFLGVYVGNEALPEQYVLFTTRNEAIAYADDKPSGYAYTVYIEIWSTVSFTALRKKIITAMQKAGFDLIREADVSDSSAAHVSQEWSGGVEIGEI